MTGNKDASWILYLRKLKLCACMRVSVSVSAHTHACKSPTLRSEISLRVPFSKANATYKTFLDLEAI
jgi:hypothetical protein